MGMFQNLTDTAALQPTEDRLGGGFEAIASGAYTGTIKLAYVGKASASNAQSITLHIDVNGKEVRETIWITNKNGENTYADKKDATKKHPIPGFVTVDDICLLATGAGLIAQETEEKIVKLYDFTARTEVNKPVQCLTALHGQVLKFGILREVVDKEAKDAAGVYQPTGETRTQNAIDKVFHPETSMTVNEYRNELTAAEFFPAWLKKNEGNDRNKAKGAAAGGAGAAGTGRPGAGMFGGAAGAGAAAGAKKLSFGKPA
jgi:hypothetical protein